MPGPKTGWRSALVIGALATIAWAGFANADTIHLRYASFDPLTASPSLPPGLQARDGTELHLLQCRDVLSAGDRADLRAAGVRILKFVPQRAFVVRMDASARPAVAGLPFVRWVGPFHPAYKVESILRSALGSAMITAPAIRCNVMLFETDGAARHRVTNRIVALGGVVHHAGSRLIDATLTPDQLREMLHSDHVMFIDRWGPFEPDMDIVRAVTGADFVEGVLGMTGQDVRGEVLDNGFNVDHVDFRSRPLIQHTAVDNQTHGTATAGILFGDGTGDPRGRGLLPSGQGIVADYQFIWPDQHNKTAELLEAPYFAVFQSSSVGRPRTDQYTTISALMDEIIFDLDLLITQANGNSGNPQSRPESWAKNIVSCGGVYHFSTPDTSDDRWNFGASSGPASDGRIYPTLVHFYDSIYTVGGGPSGYLEFGGTSASTPIVAGHFGIMFQMWDVGLFGNAIDPLGSVFENRPHAATARALMVNTAFQYEFPPGTDLGRFEQGWGLPDLERLFEMRHRSYVVDEEDVLEQGQSTQHVLTVAPGTPALKATLAYADPPGAPFSSMHRINDLTLKVIAPGGDVYWGNHGLLDGKWSVPGGAANTIDTLENVFVENPEPGDWTIEVIASEVNEDSHVETTELDSDYALVVTGILPDARRILPFNLVTGAGIHVEGFTWDVYHSDDVRYVIEQRPAPMPSRPLGELVFEGESPILDPASVSFTFEGRATTIPPTTPQRIDLFNFETGLWETVDQRVATPGDTVVELEFTSNPARFIDPGTGLMKARVGWFFPGNTLVVRWTAETDQAVWDVVR